MICTALYTLHLPLLILTKDAELKYTQNGKGVASFTIATDDGYGENKTTDFIKVICWEKTAENVSKFTKKGSLVLVEGRIKTGSYDRDGVKVYTTDIQASRVVFLPDSKSNATNDVEDVFGIQDEDVPF